MRPNQWTLPTLLMRYFVPPELHSIDAEALYRDAQASVAKDAIRAQIRAIDEGRQVVRIHRPKLGAEVDRMPQDKPTGES
jgi:hypothetical protein